MYVNVRRELQMFPIYRQRHGGPSPGPEGAKMVPTATHWGSATISSTTPEAWNAPHAAADPSAAATPSAATNGADGTPEGPHRDPSEGDTDRLRLPMAGHPGGTGGAEGSGE